MTISVGIMGAAGFAGSELTRLVYEHPNLELRIIASDAYEGKLLSDMNPSFFELSELRFSASNAPGFYDCDLIFLAVPHTAALASAPGFIEKGITVLDLSADFRLKDPEVYEKWYGVEHTAPKLLDTAVFGLPELFREELVSAHNRYSQGEAVLVACAGCYPTTSSLAAYPAVNAGLVKAPVIVDAISGVTGAGKTASERTHFCFSNENVEAYGVAKHRHTPEIEQILGLGDQVIFTPHLAPYNRGILATVYMQLNESAQHKSLEEIHTLYKEFYSDDYFVNVLALGDYPKTTLVAGTNRVHIGLALNEKTHTLIAISAADNLCKGAAGQAIQCANIVLGLPEAQGLEAVSRYI